MSRKVLVPASSAEQWRQLLPDPEQQWKTGFSAKAVAHCWQEAEDLPESVRRVFRRHGIRPFRNLETLLVFPEHQVPLPGGSTPSLSDVWVLAKSDDELVSIAVEGKVSEPFGQTLGEWLTDASLGKRIRLNLICEQLGLKPPLPLNIRYQLLYRTASAVLEARRFNATHAMMLVHSFSNASEGFDDFTRFLSLFGTTGTPDAVKSVGKWAGMFLHFAWVKGEQRYLSV